MRHSVTPEARELEFIANTDDSLMIRIQNVSRLFFNSTGEPISAVNGVSIGVKEGQLFGFLGANGAGKSTLMNMITSVIPVSNGKIEIKGKDISKERDPTLISVCPQFNSHLCAEMTAREHFYMYTLLHGYSGSEAKALENHLLRALNLECYGDKPMRELSGGNMRKMAVALAFFASSDIILLDEPTSSLDPVARRNVQDLILSYRGRKTFMLCTHLLSEAEFLCDVISIMIKGCVYAYGTPQHLSERFGTEYKIDLMLSSESEQDSKKCDLFFNARLPFAQLVIVRPKARIYSVPASAISLADLFGVMGEGKLSGDGGYCYYTCSSSSLERVFMEIVKLCESSDPLDAGRLLSVMRSGFATGKPL
jgi:ABC-type multidrug transport system ATPase subunit